jgi:hypothetical protein
MEVRVALVMSREEILAVYAQRPEAAVTLVTTLLARPAHVVARLAAVYPVHGDRGRGAHAATGLLPAYRGTVVHDGYRASGTAGALRDLFAGHPFNPAVPGSARIHLRSQMEESCKHN